jgi:hypothetical protein
MADPMNANTLLAGLAAFAVASPAAAQKVPRTPKSAFATLRATSPVSPPTPTPAPTYSVPPLVLPQPVVPASATVVDDGPPAFNSEAAKVFAARIQPVLANTCGGCHARKDHDGKFKLRYTSGDYVDHEATTANLHAAVRMISHATPGESPLLVKALAAHGGAQDPPLRSRTITAYRNLEVWVYWAASGEGAAVPDVPAVAPTPPVVAAPAPAMPANPPSVTRLTGGLVPERKPPAEEPPAPGKVTHLVLGAKEPGKLPPLPMAEPVPPAGGFATGPRAPTTSPTTPNPADPFDPAAFNRAMHPERR